MKEYHNTLKQYINLLDVQYYIWDVMPNNQTKLERLEMQQRQLIVHSFIYYVLDDNIWTDQQYDKLAIDIENQKDTKIFKESKFYSVFKDYTSATGVHLTHHGTYGNDYYFHFLSLATRLIEHSRSGVM